MSRLLTLRISPDDRMCELNGVCSAVVSYMVTQDHILVEIASIQDACGQPDLLDEVVNMEFA
jgi:hypothetical protein